MNDDNTILKKDLLQDSRLKENPYSLPDNYFAMLENQVHDKIHKPEKFFYNFLLQTKSYAYLALSFLLMLGFGYGILSLTSRLDTSAANDEFAIMLENGYLKNTFVDYLYEEMEVDDSILKKDNRLYLDDESSLEIEESLSESELMEYFGIDVPDNF